MSNATERLSKYEVKEDDGCDWRDLDTAPRDGTVVEGLAPSGRGAFPMTFGGMKPKDAATGDFAKSLFGSSDFWWAKYPDGQVGSFLPDKWRPVR